MEYINNKYLYFLAGSGLGYIIFGTDFMSALTMALSSAFDFNKIGWPDLLDFCILVVIIWYAADTYKIRKNSKAALRPHLVPSLSSNPLEIRVENPTNNIGVNVEAFYFRSNIHLPRNGRDSVGVKETCPFGIGSGVGDDDFLDYIYKCYRSAKIKKGVRKKLSRIKEDQCVFCIYRDVDSSPYITIRRVTEDSDGFMHHQSFSEPL